ncbi:hypothetical protein BC826DRAFT_1179123 [Russula brevipes]|nr:hypothetical protein BC826DRAFT_1179123 [Russula brevipes]
MGGLEHRSHVMVMMDPKNGKGDKRKKTENKDQDTNSRSGAVLSLYARGEGQGKAAGLMSNRRYRDVAIQKSHWNLGPGPEGSGKTRAVDLNEPYLEATPGRIRKTYDVEDAVIFLEAQLDVLTCQPAGPIMSSARGFLDDMGSIAVFNLWRTLQGTFDGTVWNRMQP